MVYAEYMLSGVRIYTSDAVWRQILADLNAAVLDAPTVIDLDFDNLGIKGPVTPTELKSIILAADDSEDIVHSVLGKTVSLPRIQTQIIVLLYKTGGLSSDELKRALGYAPDVTTHTIDTAIYQLRKVFGREIIQNNNGVYQLGGI